MRRAFGFLTVFGRTSPPDAGTMSWFPLTGALIGAAVGTVWWLAAWVWPPFLAGSVTVAADLACTGMLHMDGLVDAADGLLPHLSRERRLEVMREPTVGAYGVVVGAAMILLRVGAFAAMKPNVALVAALWATSRTVMALTARSVPYARVDEGGLATSMIGARPHGVAFFGLAGAFALGGVANGTFGVAAVLGCALASGAIVVFGRRRIGGFTGDVLGAAGVVGETVALLVAAAR